MLSSDMGHEALATASLAPTGDVLGAATLQPFAEGAQSEQVVHSFDAQIGVVDPNAKIENLDGFTAGYTRMQVLGIGSIASLVVGPKPMPGSKCTGGTLAEAFSMENHADTTEFIVGLAKEAIAHNEDPVQAIIRGGLGMVARRDESGQFIRTHVEPETILAHMTNKDESKKK